MSSVKETIYPNRAARRAHLAVEHARKALAVQCTVRAIIYTGPHQDFSVEFGAAWETPHANWTISAVLWFKNEADRAAWCDLWSRSENSCWVPNQSHDQQKRSVSFREECNAKMAKIPHVTGSLYKP